MRSYTVQILYPQVLYRLVVVLNNTSTFTTQGSDVMKYYFRQRLTRSNVTNDVFFFMVPTGSTGGVTPQLIQDDQQTSFISPKYSVFVILATQIRRIQHQVTT